MTEMAPASTTIRYSHYRVEAKPQREEWEVVCDYEVTVTGRPIEDSFTSVCRVATAYTEDDAQFIADKMNWRERYGK